MYFYNRDEKEITGFFLIQFVELKFIQKYIQIFRKILACLKVRHFYNY